MIIKFKSDAEILSRLIDDTNMNLLNWKLENKEFYIKYQSQIKIDNKYKMPLSLKIVYYFYNDVNMHNINFYLIKNNKTDFIRAIKCSENTEKIPETEFHKLKHIIEFKIKK